MEMVTARINGQKIVFPSKQAFAEYLLERVDSSLASLEHRVRNLERIMEFTGFPKRARFIGKITNEKKFTQAYWETLLSMQGLGTLPGFSVDAPIEKGFSNYDPEKRRISEDWTIWENL